MSTFDVILNPEDEADWSAIVAKRWMALPFRERDTFDRNLELKGRQALIQEMRAMICSEITECRFRFPSGRTWTQESVQAAFEAAYERSRVQDEPGPDGNPTWPNVEIARHYLAISDYRIWKILNDIEQCGHRSMAENLLEMAGSEDERDYTAPGIRIRKRFMEIVEQIVTGKWR